MPCDNDNCASSTGEAVTIIIDGQMRQFCGLSCTITFLEDLFDQHASSRKRVSRN